MSAYARLRILPLRVDPVIAFPPSGETATFRAPTMRSRGLARHIAQSAEGSLRCRGSGNHLFRFQRVPRQSGTGEVRPEVLPRNQISGEVTKTLGRVSMSPCPMPGESCTLRMDLRSALWRGRRPARTSAELARGRRPRGATECGIHPCVSERHCSYQQRTRKSSRARRRDVENPVPRAHQKSHYGSNQNFDIVRMR